MPSRPPPPIRRSEPVQSPCVDRRGRCEPPHADRRRWGAISGIADRGGRAERLGRRFDRARPGSMRGFGRARCAGSGRGDGWTGSAGLDLRVRGVVSPLGRAMSRPNGETTPQTSSGEEGPRGSCDGSIGSAGLDVQVRGVVSPLGRAMSRPNGQIAPQTPSGEDRSRPNPRAGGQIAPQTRAGRTDRASRPKPAPRPKPRAGRTDRAPNPPRAPEPEPAPQTRPAARTRPGPGWVYPRRKRSSSPRRTAGHSFGRIENTTVSRRVPSGPRR